MSLIFFLINVKKKMIIEIESEPIVAQGGLDYEFLDYEFF
jgi:hypothetical protein